MWMTIWALYLGRGFEKLEDFGVAHVGDQLLLLFAEFINFFSLIQVQQERLLVRVALELLNQLFDCVSAIRVLLFDCRMGYVGYSIVNVVAPGFRGTLRCAWVVTRWSCVLFLLIFLTTSRLRFQHNTWQSWEKSIHCGVIPPSSTCIPLSQCKPQPVCCRGRLHVIVFDKIAILSSERVFICNNILCFDEVSKYLWMERSLACSSCMEFPPYSDHCPWCSQQWRTQIVLPFWDFFLLGSIHFWLSDAFH